MTSFDAPMRQSFGVERALVKAQITAGALFATFVTLHLSNILIAPLGIDAFNSYQQILRVFYQHPVIEITIVIAPLVVHAVAGVGLAIIRKKRGPRPLRARFHTWAGFFLLLFIGGHVLATRGPSFFFGVFPGFEGLSFSLWYVPWYFYPYYFLLGLAGFYHASGGIIRALARQGLRVKQHHHYAATAIIGALLIVSLLALGGHLFETGHPADNDYARLGQQLFGIEI